MARMDEVTVFLATTRVLLGMDFKNIDLVLFASPFNDVASLLQGGGGDGGGDGVVEGGDDGQLESVIESMVRLLHRDPGINLNHR